MPANAFFSSKAEAWGKAAVDIGLIGLSAAKIGRAAYIQLLGEGTKVYRPVPALEVTQNIFEIQGDEIYDPDDEEWEFGPGTRVIAEPRRLDGEFVLLAIKEII